MAENLNQKRMRSNLMNREELDKEIFEGLDALFEKQSGRKVYTEADDKTEEKSDEAKKSSEEKDDKEEDEFNKVDEIVKDIDLAKINNDGRLELIEMVIDSSQNSDDEEDDFEDFVDKLFDMLERYQPEASPEDKDEEEPEPEDEPEESAAAPEEPAGEEE